MLEGRDILKKGGIWRVGNGREISICNDKWVSNFEFSDQDAEKLFDARIAWVSQLIDSQSGSWDVELVCKLFDQPVADLILQVPVLRMANDLFAWCGTKDCRFTVRSAYYVALQGSSLLDDSGCKSLVPFWNNIWKLNIAPKAKAFLWRIGHDSLPTLDNIKRRGIITDGICPVCGIAPENAAHLFLDCPWVRKLWNSFFPGLNVYSFANENVFSWYLRLKSILNSNTWNIFNTLLWLIWKNCNSALHDNFCLFPPAVLFEARKCLVDLSFASAYNSVTYSLSWTKPPKDFVKVNSDAAVFGDVQKVGFGIVARNNVGQVIGCKYLFLDGNMDILQAEASALLFGVELAIVYGFKRVVFETDALILVQELNNYRPSFLSCRHTISEIKDCMLSFDSCFFVFTKRDGNLLAHKLANLKENGQGSLPISLSSVAFSEME